MRWGNGPVAWVSRKIKGPAPQSSCESEVNAQVMLLKEGMFTAAILDFADIKRDGPTVTITDNKAAYDVIRNPGATKNTVHFDRRLHYARELYLMNAIKILLTTTERMMADMFTKATDKTTFLRCREYLMNLESRASR